MSKVSNWYRNKNVLITGASGFIGKVLIEKILRCIDGVGSVYIFLRSNKNQNVQDRWKDIVKQPIFDKINRENPKVLNKIKLIDACITSNGLIMSHSDEKILIENCNVIFHCAADVRFDQELHSIVPTNSFGVSFVFELADKMKNLSSFVYCSTAFSQYHEIVMEEKRYEPPISVDHMKKILQKYDKHTINVLTKKILGRHANTYAFSKTLAEEIALGFEGKYPIVIARPSIVHCALAEPMPGWTEGLNGINGWAYGHMRGVIKSPRGAVHSPQCLIPVDIVCNALIVLCWDIGDRRPRNIEFCNIAQGFEDAVSWGKLFENNTEIVNRIPLDYSLLPVGGILKNIDQTFRLAVEEFLYQLVPALLIDLLLILFLQKPIMLKVFKKVKYGTALTFYYASNKFVFKTENFNSLKTKLNHIDRDLFYTDLTQVFDYRYFYNYALGMRRYIAKEKDENLPRARLFSRCMHTVALVFKLMAFYYVSCFIWNRKDSMIDYMIAN